VKSQSSRNIQNLDVNKKWALLSVISESRAFVNMVVDLRVHTKAHDSFIRSEIINFSKNTGQKSRKRRDKPCVNINPRLQSHISVHRRFLVTLHHGIHQYNTATYRLTHHDVMTV